MAHHKAMRVAIGRIADDHNTALYFERAVIAAGHQVTVITDPCLFANAGKSDLFLLIDPWFEGVRDLPLLPCPTAAVLIDVHCCIRSRAAFARFVDHVFVAQRDYLPQISATGHDSVHWLPLAGDPLVHREHGFVRDIDVSFVGKLGDPGTDRHAVLTHVLSHFATNEIGCQHTPLEMGRIYSRSRIVFNKSIRGDVNMRVFEALAAGALLVTDQIGNGLDELMTDGVHYVSYATADEAVGKIKHYLQHEEARAHIAQAGEALFREHHTYDVRWAQILNVIHAAGEDRPSPSRRASPAQQKLWRAFFARCRGVSAREAAALVSEGLSLVGYSDLLIGLARGARRGMFWL